MAAMMSELRAAAYQEAVTLRSDCPPAKHDTHLGYRFALVCPRCGGPVQHRADGRSTGLTTRAIAHCATCRDDWLIEVTLTSTRRISNLDADQPTTQRRVAECGTDAGYYRHRRTLNEPACPACLDAHNAAARMRAATKSARPTGPAALGKAVDKGSLATTGDRVNV
jgi:hypothetical protein